MATTLLWAAESTGSGYNTITGSSTFTLAGGETLVLMWNGFGIGGDKGATTDSNGTFTKETSAFNAYVDSGKSYGGFYRQYNAAAGSHTLTPPTISGGQDGMIFVWKITGLGASPTIRDMVKKQQLTGSNTFNLTTSASCGVGDIAIGARWHENSVGSTDVITQPSGWTSDAQYLNGSVNLPTDGSHFVVTSAGVLSATWTDIDPAITDTAGAMIVFAAPGPTITSQPVSQVGGTGGTVTFSVSGTASAGSLSYQWQSRAEPAGTWSNISGETAASYTTGTLATSDNGKAIRVVVTDSNGSTTSAVVFVFLTGQNTGRGDFPFNSAWAFHVNRRVGYPLDLLRKRITGTRDTDQAALAVFADWYGFQIAAGPSDFATTTTGGAASSSETSAHANGATTRAGGLATATQTTARTVSATASGGGRGSATAAKSVAWAATATGGGKVADTGAKGTTASGTAKAGGLAIATGLHGAIATATAAGAGLAADSYSVASVRSSAGTGTGGGLSAASATHAASQSATSKAGGLASSTETTARALSGSVAGAGRTTDSETSARAAAATIKGAGLVSDSYTLSIVRSSSATATGGGRATASGLHAIALQGITRAGGKVTGAALHAVALSAIVRGIGTVATVGAKSVAWSVSVRGGGFADDSYLINHIDYARAPAGGRAFHLRNADTARPHEAETERPPVISGNRPGNINMARPANRGGRRT